MLVLQSIVVDGIRRFYIYPYSALNVELRFGLFQEPRCERTSRGEMLTMRMVTEASKWCYQGTEDYLEGVCKDTSVT